jgi:hypothetical protein
MSLHGTFRTCLCTPTMSVVEARTDVPRESPPLEFDPRTWRVAVTTRPSGLASGREKMKLSVRVTALSLAAVVPANHDNEMRDHGLLTS